ncbi:hypothetical protein HQ571_01400 [Candidatus Kuenenbacteria bacterium]|nr:hypothetical protein [Candidatus Kuenenbacteria bacterium]
MGQFDESRTVDKMGLVRKLESELGYLEAQYGFVIGRSLEFVSLAGALLEMRKRAREANKRRVLYWRKKDVEAFLKNREVGIKIYCVCLGSDFRMPMYTDPEEIANAVGYLKRELHMDGFLVDWTGDTNDPIMVRDNEYIEE